MKRTLLILLLLGCMGCTFAQGNGSIEEQIAGYQSSQYDLILKARKLLTDKLTEGDMGSIVQTTLYIESSLENNNYIGLYDVEKGLIYFLTGQYEKVSMLMVSVGVSGYDELSLKTNAVHPPQDLLYDALEREIKASYQHITYSIKSLVESKEEQDFLLLALESFRTNTSPYNLYDGTDGLNFEANQFLNSYPNSMYTQVIKKVIRHEYENGSWGVGFNIYGGYGFFTGSLTQSYTNPIIVGFSGDLSYKKLTAHIPLNIGLNSLNKDMDYSLGFLEKGEAMRVWNTGLCLGVSIFENSLCMLTPYAGISYFGIRVPNFDEENGIEPELKEININTYAYSFGLNLDFKVWSEKILGAERSQVHIRLGYSYSMPHFGSKYPKLTGRFHQLTLGIGYFSRNIIKKQ